MHSLKSGLIEELKSMIVFEPEFRDANALRGPVSYTHLAVPSLRKGWCCVYAAFSTSMMLETVQLLTERDYCQLDDVVTNTLRAASGYLVLALVRKCWRGKIEE